MKKFIIGLLGIASGFAVAGVGVKLWAWFLVPLGVPAVTIWHLLGVQLLVSSNLTGALSDAKIHKSMGRKYTDEQKITFAATRVLTAVIILGFAYLYHLGV